MMLRLLTRLQFCVLLGTIFLSIQLITPVAADTPYRFTLVASTGNEIDSIGTGVSINDKGVVAFVAQKQDGSQDILLGDRYGVRNITLGHSTDFLFDEAVQINNTNQVVATDRTVSFPKRTFVRRWNGKSTNAETMIARGQNSAVGYPFDTILTRPSINDNGDVVFSAVKGTSTVLATLRQNGDRNDFNDFNKLSLAGNVVFRPMIANDGHFIAQQGDTSTSPIILYNYNATPATFIAGKSRFDVMGGSPGISADGKIVVFYGDLNANGAATLGMSPGKGYFVCIKSDSGLVYKRVAGVASNGAIDPGETWIDANHNGTVDVGEDAGPFADFSADARVSVQSCGKDAQIVYTAIGTDGKLGLYISTLFLPEPGGDTYTVGPPGLIIEQGYVLDGLVGDIQDIVANDPVNKSGEIAFWVSTTTGAQAVVRAINSVGDTPLELDTVNSWFNQFLSRGDLTPCEVRSGNDVRELVDGEETFAEMVQAIRTATGPGHFIYLLNWWMSDDFPLIPDDPSTTMQALLKAASDAGVEVRAMLWDQLGFQNISAKNFINGLLNGSAILDNRTLYFGSHHQKILVVNGSEGLIAFCGGVDFNPDRLYAQGEGPNSNGDTAGAPLHDVHCRIMGPAAGDLLLAFVHRWFDYQHSLVTQRRRYTASYRKQKLLGCKDENEFKTRFPSYITPASLAGQTKFVQIGFTYGNGTKHPGIGNSGYSFAPYGEQTVRQIFEHAIKQAKKFIYIEDQYLVSMEASNALLEALPHIEHLTIVIPGGSITSLGGQTNYRRSEFIEPLLKWDRDNGTKKVRVFYLKGPGTDGKIGDKHTYVHAKTWVFDDEFAIIGSANCNRRSWTHDSEVIAGICDRGDGQHLLLPHELRMRLWAEHLGLDFDCPEIKKQLSDGVKAADLWLIPPPDARIKPYVEYEDIELFHPDSIWDTLIDPDGS